LNQSHAKVQKRIIPTENRFQPFEDRSEINQKQFWQVEMLADMLPRNS
jgi:hypothetical protein